MGLICCFFVSLSFKLLVCFLGENYQSLSAKPSAMSRCFNNPGLSPALGHNQLLLAGFLPLLRWRKPVKLVAASEHPSEQPWSKTGVLEQNTWTSGMQYGTRVQFTQSGKNQQTKNRLSAEQQQRKLRRRVIGYLAILVKYIPARNRMSGQKKCLISNDFVSASNLADVV